MALTQLKTGAIADDAVTTDKLANAINTERTANTAKVQTTINNNADNRLITGSGTANTLEGESNATYNGTLLKLTGSNEADLVQIATGNSGGDTFASIRGDNEAGIRIRGGGSERGGEIELAGGSRNTDPAVIKFSTNTSNSFEERMRLDSSGRLLLNNGSNVNNYPIWGINGKVQLTGTGWDTTGLSINNFGNNTTRGTIQFMKSKNGTIGNYSTSPAANESLGTITWAAADTTDANNVHAILDVTTTAPATANNGYGRFVFTTQHGTSTGTRLMIDNDGVKFNGDTAAANALDDYEEGTWTPNVFGNNSGSYTTRNGNYTKIGNVVHLDFYVDVTSANAGGGSQFLMYGLPFQSTGLYAGSVMFKNHSANNNRFYVLHIGNNVSYMAAYGSESSANWEALTADGSFEMIGQITYRTNS